MGQPGTGGEDDLVGVEGAADGSDARIGAACDCQDVGAFVHVHAGSQQGAMDDGRPALGVDLAVGVDGGAGEIGWQQRFTPAGFVGLDEVDVQSGLSLPGDTGEELPALFVGAGEAEGGALGEAHVESAEIFEIPGEFRKGVAPVQPQPEEGRVVVGIVLGADEAARG